MYGRIKRYSLALHVNLQYCLSACIQPSTAAMSETLIFILKEKEAPIYVPNLITETLELIGTPGYRSWTA